MRKLLLLAGFLTIVSCGKEIGLAKIAVSERQPIMPVLVGKEQNRVLEFQLNVLDSLATYKVASINFNFEGTTDISDIKDASVLFYSENMLGKASTYGNQSNITSKFKVEGNQVLSKGNNFFWLTLTLNRIPNLLNKVEVKLESIEFRDGSLLKPTNETSTKPQRIGIALRRHGQDNVDTYRIPGLATTNKGALIAVYDNRYNSSVDLQADIDIGMSRSADGGQTWEPMKVILDMGEYGELPQDQNGIGDPSVMVDRTTGTIWVAAVWAHGNPGKRNWFASKPGIKPEDTSQFILVKSEDDGLTWSRPINITSQIKKPEWYLLLQGPGKGITLKDGTLVFPAQFKDAEQIPHSTIIYSKDQGKTWKIGTGAKSNTTEAQVVELQDRSLMLNMRDNRGGSRSVYTTKDMGKTWIEHPSSRKALIEPVCMASLIGYEEGKNRQILLFSNPNSTKKRTHITIKTSFDEGLTWPKENQMELYEDACYGYSCMTVIDKNHIGILYEGKGDLYFEKMNIHELLGNKE